MTATIDTAAATATKTRRVCSSESTYGELVDFLIDEANMLDEDRYHEWLDTLAEDISYRMPLRKTVYRKTGDGIDERVGLYNDSFQTLAMRVRTMEDVAVSYGRNPVPRLHRAVTNVVVHEGENPGEYKVDSHIQVFRNRLDDHTYEMEVAKRHDVIRRTPEGLRLASRVVLLDQVVLVDTFSNVIM